MEARTVWPGWTPYSARIERAAPTRSCSAPNVATASASARPASGRGQAATLIDASSARPGNRFHNVSVM
jgi:hypothetical protein